jgi:hypothetical protein
VVVAAAFLVFVRTPDEPAAQRPPVVPVKAAVLGIGAKPEQADPCRLVDAAPLKPFGDAKVDEDYGNFDRCDVIIQRGRTGDGQGPQADVKVELLNPPADGGAPAGQRTRSGPFAVFGDPGQDGSCTRLVQLQDQYLVRVGVNDDQGDNLDVCQAADIAVASATKVLAAAGVPARTTPYPAASLAQLNACTLLDQAALAGTAGVTAPVRVQPGFGNWGCDWESDATTRAVTVMFDRDQPPGPDKGQLVHVAGRDVYAKADDFAPKTCQALLVYRQYTDSSGEAAVEEIKVVVHGDPPSDRLCTPATALAGDVVAKLPKP